MPSHNYFWPLRYKYSRGRRRKKAGTQPSLASSLSSIVGAASRDSLSLRSAHCPGANHQFPRQASTLATSCEVCRNLSTLEGLSDGCAPLRPVGQPAFSGGVFKLFERRCDANHATDGELSSTARHP
jgi:hypothetical protein